jgi:hypothetical protein
MSLTKANENQYISLDPKASVLDNLRGLEILEFPTISVVDKIPPEWCITEREITVGDNAVADAAVAEGAVAEILEP